MSINELYQELIIDHGTEPRNHCCLKHFTNNSKGFNPLCGDKVHIYLELENNIIKQASFEGSGCAISIASASIMTEVMHGKTISQADTLFKVFQNLVTDSGGDANTNDPVIENSLEKLQALAGVKEFPSRVKCATLAWHTLNSALKDDNKLVTTK